MRRTLALGMLVTALYLAPQHARAEAAAQFNLEQAIAEAKTPADYEAIASYYDQAATTMHAKAATAHKLAEAYRNLAITGKSQFQSWGHYQQLEQYYESLAVDYTAHAKVYQQRPQAVVHKPQ